jgi:hypothetical protein
MSARDHDELCALVHRLVSSWNAGDADGLAGAFADHRELSAFVCACRAPRLAGAIDAVRFLREDIAVVDATLVACDRDRARSSAAGIVAMKDPVGWRIVAFHDGHAASGARWTGLSAH